MKKILALILAMALALSLAACGGDKSSSSQADSQTSTSSDAGNDDSTTGGDAEDVKLTVWGGEEDQSLLRSLADEFIAANADQVNLTIDVGVESESTAKDTILNDVEAAADVFAFANDQIGELHSAGALQEVLLDTDRIKADNTPSSIESASVNGTLYAYPMTADNGYFMFYNSEYFTEDDVKTLDRMLEVAAENGKKVSMEFTSGWYLYSWFKGAGLEAHLLEDGINNYCNWNEEPGVAVVEAILAASAHAGFKAQGDAEFVTGVKDGSVIAGVNGTWNAAVAAETWGENYAATKLPTYTLDGEQVQMASFSGYKLVGVNAFSDNTGWAMKFADYITNYDSQVRRFEERQAGPSNLQAAASDAVKADPAQAAFAAQLEFSGLQLIGGNYWSPTESFGEIMTQGNPNGTDPQTLLDNMVEGIVAPIE